MIEACGKMETRPFFIKFRKHGRGFRYLYCEGPLKEQCVRITYKDQNGVKPPDELPPQVLFSTLKRTNLDVYRLPE